MRLSKVCRAAALASAVLGGFGVGARAQQVVRKFDVFAGFADLNSPDLGLDQRGFHTQFGWNARSWMSIGFDYSVAPGDEVLTVGLLPANLQAQVLGAEAAYIKLGYLPANYVLRVPTHAVTNTFAFGPQYVNRHFRHMTLFVRPSLGALHEHATPHPTDAFSTGVAAQLAPMGYKQDWTGFYGAGGGAEYTPGRNFGVRAQFDGVYNHPFNDILANGRWTYRSSIGVAYHFGPVASFAKKM